MVTLRHRGPNSTAQVNCSFCHKSRHDVAKVVAGPNGVHICNECIDLCNDIVVEEMSPGGTEGLGALLRRAAAGLRDSDPQLAGELDAAACPLP